MESSGPNDSHIVDTLFQAVQNEQLALFVGSGLSTPSFPSWTELVQKLAARTGTEADPSEHPVAVLTRCQDRLSLSDWLSHIADSFSLSEHTGLDEVSPAYRYLANSPVTRIVTSNYDSLPTILWPGREVIANTSDELATVRRRLHSNKKHPFVMKLHGCHTRPETMIVTEQEYNKMIYARDDVKEFLKAIWSDYLVLFVGFGLRDEHLKSFLISESVQWENKVSKFYAIVANATQKDKDRYLAKYDMKLLTYEAHDGNHDGLLGVLKPIFESGSTKQPFRNRRKVQPQRAPQMAKSPRAGTMRAPTIADAFPFDGPVRIIYTCRSTIDEPRFACPCMRTSAVGTLSLHAHMPIDEIESIALCLNAYGEQIVHGGEAELQDAMVCSLAACDGVDLKPFEPLKCDGNIPSILTDNMIIIGENALSNSLVGIAAHQLAWKHCVIKNTQILAGIGGQAVSGFSVRPVFRERAQQRIKSQDGFHPAAGYYWGIMTYMPNPFAPDTKRILQIVGCRRPGQYLLLSWLRSEDVVPVYTQIMVERNRTIDGDRALTSSVQIAVKGAPPPGMTKGRVCRGWSADTVIHESRTHESDDGRERSRPFFVDSVVSPSKRAKAGDKLTDVSLLGELDDGEPCVTKIVETLPRKLLQEIKRQRMQCAVGYHVTLFEFLHTIGRDKDGLARELMEEDGRFVIELRKTLGELPVLSFRLRQARVTSWSLQVLVDAFFDVNEYIRKLELRDQSELSEVGTAMELVEAACRNALLTIDEPSRKELNVCRIPFPLHLTLLRFNNESQQFRKKAEQWTQEHKHAIWGCTERISFQLTHATRAPFADVSSIEVSKH